MQSDTGKPGPRQSEATSSSICLPTPASSRSSRCRLTSDLIFWLWTLSWLAYCTFGCAPYDPPAGVTKDSVCWNRNIEPAQSAWLEEARRRFANPFVWVGHGDTADKAMWRVRSDGGVAKANIEAVGKLLHELMPDRDVVLVSCNAEGIHPKLPKRVWYCPKGVVWVYPGESLRLYEGFDWEWGSGSIFDFIEGSN